MRETADGPAGTRQAKVAAAAGEAPEAEIDLGKLPGLLGYQLRLAQLSVFQSFGEAMAPWGLSPGQLGVLEIIANNPGLNQTQLSKALGIDRSTLVAVLDGLEGRGLLARKPSPSDRRSHALELTGRGAALLREIGPSLDSHERRIAEPLSSADRRTLIALLRRMNGF